MSAVVPVLTADRRAVPAAAPIPEYVPLFVPCPQSPNRGGVRKSTAGVIIHSTRGGAAYGREFQGAINWFAGSASRVSAHAIVSRAGEIALPVPDDREAWHAGQHNADHLGLELEQPTIRDDYTDAQLRAAAWLVRDWCDSYAVPIDRDHIFGHSESAQGRSVGKSDPGPTFDWDRFMALLAGDTAVSRPQYSREQVVEIVCAVADEYGIPRDVLLGCAIAESGLDVYARRPKDPALDESYWADVSGGLHQRAVRWSQEYAAKGFSGEYPGAGVVEQILGVYYDPWHSSRVAASTLRHCLEQSGGDELGALARYNAPALNGGWKSPTHRANYARGLAEARALLA